MRLVTLATMLVAILATATVKAWRLKYPREYFIEASTSNYKGTLRLVAIVGCETLLSSNLTAQFLVSCPSKRSNRNLRLFRFKRILDISEDTLPEPIQIKHLLRSRRRCKKGSSLFEKYSSTPRYPFSWHLRAIGAESAWKRGCDGTGVTIAEVGSRAYCNHPAIASAFISSKAFSFDSVAACTPTGLRGLDPVGNLASSMLSVVLANNQNMTGVAPGAKFFPVAAPAAGEAAQYAVALLYAAAAGADIIFGTPLIPGTPKNDKAQIRLYRATFRAVERLGSLPVLYGDYAKNPFGDADEAVRNGTQLTFADLGRCVVLTRGTRHNNEWCPKGLSDYSGLVGPNTRTAPALAATCGNATYVNRYTHRRPFTAYNPAEVDTPLSGLSSSNVAKPHVCAPAGSSAGRCYSGCESTCDRAASFGFFCSSCKADTQCLQAVYNVVTAAIPDIMGDSAYGLSSEVHASGMTTGAAALLLQAYPELKGRPYALRQLLLAAAKRTKRASKSACGAGFLDLKRIFG